MSGESSISSSHACKYLLSFASGDPNPMGLVSPSGIGLFRATVPSHHIYPARGHTSSVR
jgi:hypothetical protein